MTATRKRTPAGVTGAALRRHYLDWANDEGIDLDPSDHALIERLVQATDIARKLEAAINRDGVIVVTPATLAEKPHPALPSLRGQTELSAKLITVLDKRIQDAASDTPVNRGGVAPFAVRGQYDKTGTDDTPATAIRRPSRTPATKRGGRKHGS
ncbi:hypothetical protein [Gordonia polyisoprenivorans]|uniref:hypothetical protein n=1 Tax=Gordonia polyisoprenivorans TaxID=84595 RepID=UPI000B99E21C|nr:hypothetical protein [Gordonia polyisoprenivorans]OZC31220.1 hypothetical protein CJJ17_06845 [Gordonia polyisoprenivorans]